MRKTQFGTVVCSLAFGAALVWSAAGASAAVYNANSTFVAAQTSGSPANATMGPFRAGYYATSLGSFTTFSAGHHVDDVDGDVAVKGFRLPAGVPIAAVNVSASEGVLGYTSNLNPGEIFLHPSDTQLAAIRFTAPIAGTFKLTGAFDETLDAGTTRESVRLNLTSIAFDTSAAGNSLNFTNVTGTVTVGDTIDFVVTAGSDGASSDSTGLFASIEITPIPEPATLALVAAGGWMLRRRRQLG